MPSAGRIIQRNRKNMSGEEVRKRAKVNSVWVRLPCGCLVFLKNNKPSRQCKKKKKKKNSSAAAPLATFSWRKRAAAKDYEQQSLRNTARHQLAIGNRYSAFDSSTSCFQGTWHNSPSTFKALTFPTSVVILSLSLVALKQSFLMGSAHSPPTERRREEIWPVKTISSFEQELP